MTRLRSSLPPLPAQLAHLPAHRGYPVPWFVAWLDEKQNPLPRGQGTPDFRVIAPGAIEEALHNGMCWICGDRLPKGYAYAFVVGPMCAVNRTSAEPPSHIVCADWSARACPFLSNPEMVRRDRGKPEHATEAAGYALQRNPGVALVWVTKTASAFNVPESVPGAGPGILFNIGEPLKVRWYAEGRDATREEVMASIDSGFPLLEEIAAEEGPDALVALGEMVAEARDLVPA